MATIGIIGGGIAGLTAAYLLRDAHDVRLFEGDARVGGHAHTIVVNRPTGPRPIDTGFVVYNERTYPLFTKLLARLGVTSQITTISFGMRDDRERVEYGTHAWRSFVSKNLLRRDTPKLLADAARFKAAVRRWENREDATLGDFLDGERFGRAFTEFVALPLTATVWSIDFPRARAFPFQVWWRFLANHGLGAVFDPPPWRSFADGSRAYIGAIERALGDRITRSAPATRVERQGDGVLVSFADRAPIRFDEVILATHADQARAILAGTDREAELLGTFRYNTSPIVVHTDTSVLPKNRAAWSAWNYLRGIDATGPTVTYNMNVLHRFEDTETFGVSLNLPEGGGAGRGVDPARVIARMRYAHPIFTREVFAAQRALAEISGRDRVHFAGGYLGMSFHEDAVRSADVIARRLAPSAALSTS